jgi:ABC-type polysaccharide/polyol phosphate transport system ATPase subunit
VSATVTTPGIEFEHVSKRFRYGVVHRSLRELLPDLALRMVGRRPPLPEELPENAFWALRDVSFRVEPGEALGIIGPNGSGKSTALRLLTRVLKPTLGHCRVRGRVGALIELSAGFHPDLTGRENVYLQGQIMGMPRADIARKFDAIVDFAGVERAIDTPVKRYSSGMVARLGFAIAAHLDPEVLLIDEALAVGDASFQRKALAHVQGLVRQGVPVVLVSHQLDQVTAMCTRALLLEYGHVAAEGTPAECVAVYLQRALHQKLLADAAIVVKRFIELPNGTTVGSGERLPMLLDVIVRHPERRDDHEVLLRLVMPATRAILWEAPLESGGAQFPRHSEWFHVRTSLQLNVPPGPYQVECAVRERLSGREISFGPTAHIEVVPTRPFEGGTQLNLESEVTHAEEHGPEADYAAPARSRLAGR